MKKWWKIIRILFFPITIIGKFFKVILNKIDRKISYQYLTKMDINRIDNLSGKEFEDLLYLIFSNLNLKVKKTKVTGDYGADLILDLGHEKIAIQCKLYYKHSVGTSAIQEIVGAMNYYNCAHTWVITNSKYTSSARTLATSTQTILWDRDNLRKFLELNKSQKIYLLKELFISPLPDKKYNSFQILSPTN